MKRCLALVFCCISLWGCGTTRASFIPSGEPKPRPVSESVLVFFEASPPTKPFDVIGMIFVEKEANSATRWDVVKPEEVVALLQKRARQAGADAIIVGRIATLPGRARDYKKAEAQAIVFR